jgi:hypothetical protein
MRPRDEIMKKYDECKFLGVTQLVSPIDRAQSKNQKLILEVLLDIRELLETKTEEK